MIDMTLQELLPENVNVVPDAQLSDYTTFRLGGPCPMLIDCPDADSLAQTARCLADSGMEFVVIGQGSNLLVADSGIGIAVLRYCTEFDPEISIDGSRVKVAGSVLLDDFVRLTIEKGIGDVSFCSGIPGTVGGAIAGNAGAFGQQIGDVVESVTLLDPAGNISEVEREKLEFTYRNSILKQTGSVVLAATLKLKSSDVEIMTSERERILELRRTMHPDWKTEPCAGSVFRNIEPSSAAERRQAAGWFLEEAGAKALRVGGAHLYEKHANIIIAEPGATARDVFLLSEKMIAAVRERFGFDLIREIKLVGGF